ncbi:Unknown protein [Striga hermonthica]|uniref:S-protein homolog n=1 Tax=Striga hermonthica TaxID=68872 RepID=A0A9N7RMJ9_STRHE|nr:Unknown protein [Striga hermonthica]
MCHYWIKFLVISIVLLVAKASSTVPASSWKEPICVFGAERYVRVVNAIQPAASAQLWLHCASGNDEKGYHDLSAGQEFKFTYCPLPRSLYFCRLWWAQKTVAFIVSKTGWRSEYCTHNTCYWEARSDGIYHSADSNPQHGTKVYNWS